MNYYLSIAQFAKTFVLLLYLLLLLMPLSCATNSSKTGSTIADDKIKHLAYSLGISAATAAYYQHERGEDRCKAAAIGFGFSLSLGAGKETYDKYVKKTYWDWSDITWDIIGSSVGSLIGSGCH